MNQELMDLCTKAEAKAVWPEAHTVRNFTCVAGYIASHDYEPIDMNAEQAKVILIQYVVFGRIGPMKEFFEKGKQRSMAGGSSSMAAGIVVTSATVSTNFTINLL